MDARPEDRRSTSVGSLIICAVFSLLSLWLIGSGVYYVWAQHSGTPASVELIECRSPNNFSFPAEFSYGGGARKPLHTSDCTAIWRPVGGTEQRVTVKGVPRPHRQTHQGQVEEVKLHGDRAYTNSLWLPVPAFIWGVLSGVLALLPVRPWRRFRQRQSL
jgi:hypothetical protein